MINEKKIGKSGSITIPAHLRRDCGISTGDRYEIVPQDDDLEEELDIIKEHKNWELVSRFFGTDEVDLEKLKRAIFVEEILAFGTKFKDKSDDESAM